MIPYGKHTRAKIVLTLCKTKPKFWLHVSSHGSVILDSFSWVLEIMFSSPGSWVLGPGFLILDSGSKFQALGFGSWSIQ